MAAPAKCPFVRFDSGTALVCCQSLLVTNFCSDEACPNRPMRGAVCTAPRYESGKGVQCSKELTRAATCTDPACSMWKPAAAARGPKAKRAPTHSYALRSGAGNK
jgi:hypothetical protein